MVVVFVIMVAAVVAMMVEVIMAVPENFIST